MGIMLLLAIAAQQNENQCLTDQIAKTTFVKSDWTGLGSVGPVNRTCVV